MLINTDNIKFASINYQNGYFIKLNDSPEVNMNLLTEKVHDECMIYLDRSQIFFSTKTFECIALDNESYDSILNIVNKSIEQIGSKFIVNY